MYYLNQSPVGQVQFLVQSVRHLSFADVEKMKDLSFTKFHRLTDHDHVLDSGNRAYCCIEYWFWA